MKSKMIGIKKTALVSALLIEISTVHAAIIDVDGTTCTLADAITSANDNTATGGCIAGTETGSSADEIVLPVDAQIVLSSVLPDITSSITINGNGTTISRDDSAGALTILNISLEYGSEYVITLNDVSITNGQAAGDNNLGGGINQYEGVLNINRCQISGNTGGGIYTYGVDLNIVDSVISNNTGPVTSIRNAAGLTFISGYTQSANYLTINNSTIADNHNFGSGNGGGIFLTSVGAYAYNKTVITNSTISNNSTQKGGGGIHALGQGYFSTSVTLNMTGLTVVNNSTATDGGGIFNEGGNVSLKQVLVSGNSAGNLVPEIANTGSLNLNNYNLFGLNGSSGIFGAAPGANDKVISEAELSQVIDTTLRENGGFTLTHALSPNSPAIDFIPAVFCVGIATDQTGKSRPIDGDGDGTADCDVGAFEYTDVIFQDGFD